ncbi:DNA repair protein RecN [Actinomyces capricornis]|uniref:DNA repair protein RecN n=1 Tax=Actinomyces capricornis TaxID=2755559 RepID=A0ABM7U6I4_9ACTO|nr:DNA repair protein RecN [Actinomyces capricornis]BDA63196.1 DNA repair protein RecN [Actinomyces capricornis]
MIESLHIEDLGVIHSADLALSPGLTALTGETGAGKTMVLTSLGLLLGQRAESGIVRAGAQRCLVEGAFILDPDSRAAERALEAGAELDEEVLLASRTVPASGRSRAHLGGRSVPSTVLAQVGGALVSVHGQADQLRLRSAAAQRAALDSLGGAEHRQLCRRYSQAYRERAELAQALEDWQASARSRGEEAARLRRALEALEALDPAPGEDRELAAEADRLDHAEDLRRAATTAQSALSGDEEALGAGDGAPDVVALLSEAQRALAHEAQVDPALAELAERTGRLGIEAADIASELSSYLAGLQADPARLAYVQDRRAALLRACRETAGPGEQIDDVDALLAWGQRAAARLAEIDGPQDGAAVLAERLAGAEEDLAVVGAELSRARRALARRLEEDVTAELEGLHMKGSRLVVELTELDEPGPTGAESVALALVSHPGAPALPLGKGASGGELSRIMLALEVVLAEAAVGTEPGPGREEGRSAARTLVFDEIDAGVGGRAAREIGRRLARLARRYQVVVVTHLAQVAAWADTHIVVRKETEPEAPRTAGEPTTRTSVVVVEGAQRRRELARMLSGHEDSEAAVRHAAELLDEAGMAESQA